MDFGAALSVAQTLFAALQCTQLREVWSIWDYKSELDGLTTTVETIKAVLLDAEAKQDQLSHEALHYVEELRDALYDADDLLDEFITLVSQKLLMQGNKFSKKVRAFFSRYNSANIAYQMSHGVKTVMKKLDAIASNHSKFGLNLNHTPIRKRREETCSYVNTSEIIGRDDDVDKIVAKLLGSDDQQDVSFLTVVGMGGLGKTALAQLVYNDPKIAQQFPLRIWTCVSDQDQKQFDVQAIMGQILESATGHRHDGHSMEVLQRRLCEHIAGKRFLLVLDDVWTENRVEWCKLVGYLISGQKGSWVVVTSRSKQTAKIVGNTSMYELQGLSDENSWRLFQLTAFEGSADVQAHREFIEIGEEIVKKCANVPLAIKVIGSLLYGQEKSKWMSVKEIGVTNLRESQHSIKEVLKLSYHNLETPLKSCFSYCALYPKDSQMEKETLINLWMAQGYVVPLENGQSLEDAAEEYFLILVRRCFLQDVGRNMYDIVCKMHDFMHDVAIEVSQKEIRAGNYLTGNLDKKVRHVSISRNQDANSFTKANIRSLLQFNHYYLGESVGGYLDSLASYKGLRSLDLSYLNFESLPDSIGKLLHLRYLKISSNEGLKLLPESITKLYNLQVLNLYGCHSLVELPKDLSKLLNLRILDLECCSQLSCTPLGMEKLTGLHKLTKFVVANGNPRKQRAELKSLGALKNLRGSIEINIHFPERGSCINNGKQTEAVAFLSKMEHLNSICFECKHEESNGGGNEYEEELLGDLQPHSNLKELILGGYRGERMPRWATGNNMATFLPGLVKLSICGCWELQSLSSLSKLKSLKFLLISELLKVEYIEDMSVITHGEGLKLFPSLEKLYIRGMPKLKGWWRSAMMDVDEDESASLSFPQLRMLKIYDCSMFSSILWCPNLEELNLSDFNGRLRIGGAAEGRCDKYGEASSYCPTLKEVTVDNVAWLHSGLPMEALQGLTVFALKVDTETESLSQIFRACSSSLETLSIINSSQLRSVSRVLTYLTALKTLELRSLPIESLGDEEKEGEDEEAGMPWGSLHHTLQSLKIYDCRELQCFPKWMRNLSSLQLLDVFGCSEALYQRCQKPNGEDWPNIQHIPNVYIKKCSI